MADYSQLIASSMGQTPNVSLSTPGEDIAGSTVNPYVHYQNWFQNTPIGKESAIDWAGGKLWKTGADQAIYWGPGGQEYSFGLNTPLNQIASDNPEIRKLWEKIYGPMSSWENTYVNPMGSNYEIPEDAYPTAESTTGIDSRLRDELVMNLINNMGSSIKAAAGAPQSYMDEAKKLYEYLTGTALKKQIPQVLNNLANRGIMSSTAGQNILKDVASEIATNAGEQGYAAAMNAAMMRLQVPQLLGNLAESTRYSESRSEDKSARERLMVQLLMGLM